MTIGNITLLWKMFEVAKLQFPVQFLLVIWLLSPLLLRVSEAATLRRDTADHEGGQI